MDSRRYTIQDIARAAKVGVGTVSRVLNDDPNVKDSTREHVQSVIERLGYQPSFAARSLRTQKSQTIGFIADAVATTPYAVHLIKGAQDAAWNQGKLLLVIDADNDPKLRERALESMLEREVEGIVYAAMFHQEVNLPDSFQQIPTVLVDCFDPHSHFPSVVPDEVQGAKLATQTLIRHGHKRIGHIANDRLDIVYPAPRLRFEGYKQALSDAHIDFDPTLMCESDGNALSGAQCALELIALADPPTALFCGTDRIAMGVYDALKEQGLSIPEDISIIGFDNQEIIAAYLNPALSTIALPHYEMGQWAIDYLLSGSTTNIQELVSCPLVKRASIGLKA
ncbi:MAG: LacI family DNA-binding transcriptional regulator [Trueperaceae bacterium]|nr:LacI family DNA-binding transcriptional regulator [Trueperaceae bacterium]